MLFNSIEFLIFLPLVFALYWIIGNLTKSTYDNNPLWQNVFIIIASYVFYGWWNWKFLGLIILATTTSYSCGILLDKYNNPLIRKSICIANIIVSLGILGIYKYYNFFVENFANLLSLFGITPGWVTLDLVLPVGISFYTFQTLSYTIDVYRKSISATHNSIAFFAFISFFPQLVAGPIERADNLLPQFLIKRLFRYNEAVDGMRLILWGAFKKIVVADNCGIIVDQVFDNYSHLGGVNLLLGAILFSFQIYGDFSGYTDIAIGTSKLFGINLRRNFNFPYFSRDIAEFWRRWHISLSAWFRDYIYIPLGGNRKGLSHTVRNTIIVFLVSGFWHGADWTFISWGAFNALLFIPLLITNRSRKYKGSTVAAGRFLPSLKELLLMTITFLLVVIGRILYRAETIPDAVLYFRGIFSNFNLTSPTISRSLIVYIFIMLAFEWINRERSHGFALTSSGIFRYRIVRWFSYYILTMLIILQSSRVETFIYFQF